MFVLSTAGAKVVHPRAVSAAVKFNCPFWVRSTFNDDTGTLIGKKGEAPGGLYGLAIKNNLVLTSLPHDPGGVMKKYAYCEWFYKQSTTEGEAIAAFEPDLADALRLERQLKEVGVVTVQWDPDAAITKEQVSRILEDHGLTIEEQFDVPGGGAWAVAANKAREALLAIYRAPLIKN
jgi:aspartokinase